MAQYGGEQYRKEEGHHNQLHSTTTGHEIGGGAGTNVHSTTAGHDTGGTIGTGGGHGYEEGKHGGTGGILHRSGSGSSSSSESDGEGGRRKKKGVAEKIKERLPGGDHGDAHKTSDTANVASTGGYGHGQEGEEGHEKKGLMDKIKEKLPGSH